MPEQSKSPTDDQPLGVPPSEFHPQRPPAPFKRRGNVKTVILVAILIVVIDLCIYFFLIKPDDSHLFKAIEPLKPQEAVPSVIIPSTSNEPLPSQQAPNEQTAKVTALAKEDLAKRLKINVSEIEVVSEESVTWSDGSLGCPQPGMMYTQATVEGTKVVLSAEQKNYNYHAGTKDQPVLCEKSTQ